MFLAALVLSTTIQAERWVPLGGSAGQQEYLDKESVKRSGDKVTLFTRREIPAEKATYWEEIEFDCAAGTDTIVAWIRSDERGVDHNVVRPHRAAAPIAPNSPKRRAFEIACR
jgi:hypothetical protein